MTLHALVYFSQAISGLTIDQIDDLTQDAAEHNHLAGVTGILLTDGIHFLQYIEGPEDGLALTYSRILNARSHTEIVELGRSRGGQRRFPYRSMRWIPVDEPELRIAVRSDWRGLAQRRVGLIEGISHTGIDRMRSVVGPYIN